MPGDNNDRRHAGIGKGTPGPGRPKGALNTKTIQLREMILRALDQAGGADYLARQAEEAPAAFLALVGRVLPTTLAGDANAPLTVVIRRFGAGDGDGHGT